VAHESRAGVAKMVVKGLQGGFAHGRRHVAVSVSHTLNRILSLD